jgi:hypothetical protein
VIELAPLGFVQVPAFQFIPADFAYEKNGVDRYAGNDESEEDDTEDQRDDSAPIEDDPTDIDHHRQYDQTHAQRDKERDRLCAGEDAHQDCRLERSGETGHKTEPWALVLAASHQEWTADRSRISSRKEYLRGQASLVPRDGNVAAIEFQKFIDHRGLVLDYPRGALARMGLARAYVIQGDNAKARVAYQEFLMLWKDADPDIPILKRAKVEYAKLQ